MSMSKKLRFTLPALLLGTSLLLAACGDEKPAATTEPAKSEPAAKAGSATFKPVVDDYRKFVIDQCDQFVKSTQAFTDAVKAGDIEKAKSLYAPSRMYFERIEPIAEALGDFDPHIDARENDVPDNEWRGFHRLEKALWQDKSVQGQEKTADQLLQDVKLLRVKAESVEIDAKLLVTGSVELLNEVSATKVTGEEERYSHTDLYDFVANVEGSKEIFKVIRPELEKKDAKLATDIDTKFANLEQALAPYKKGEGYVLYTELTPEQTKQLSQALDALAEPLSQMGTVLEG
jgi:iron uptake system component EfeO